MLDKLINKRGGAEEIFLIAAIPIIIIAFFGAWIFVNQTIETTLLSTPEQSDIKVNITEATEATFGNVNDGLAFLRLIAFTIFFGIVLSFFILNVFVKSHPFLYIVYVLVSMFATILSVYISNFYEQYILTMTTLGPTYQSFTIMNFVMLNLPIMIGVIGIFGAILLFINLPRDGGLTDVI